MKDIGGLAEKKKHPHILAHPQSLFCDPSLRYIKQKEIISQRLCRLEKTQQLHLYFTTEENLAKQAVSPNDAFQGGLECRTSLKALYN